MAAQWQPGSGMHRIDRPLSPDAAVLQPTTTPDGRWPPATSASICLGLEC